MPELFSADDNTWKVPLLPLNLFAEGPQMHTINELYWIKASIIGMTVDETELSNLIPEKHGNIYICLVLHLVWN